MVTTNWKHVIDIHTKKKKAIQKQHYSHQITGEQKRKGKKDLQNKSKTINKMTIGTYISIITLHVNELNTQIKRHRLANWIQNKTHIYAIYKRPSSDLSLSAVILWPSESLDAFKCIHCHWSFLLSSRKLQALGTSTLQMSVVHAVRGLLLWCNWSQWEKAMMRSPKCFLLRCEWLPAP